MQKENTVRTWRRRFARDGLDGLRDRPRSGRPPVYSPSIIASVKAIACELPAERNLPLSRMSLNDIMERVRKEIHPSPSRSSVHRWLKQDALRPWYHRSWISPRDPDFLEKALPVLELYNGRWNGNPLGPEDVILCADEKTAIQALRRPQPTKPPSSGHPVRVEHEYERKGTVSYVAALNVRRGKVYGWCPNRNGKKEFREFVNMIMEREPCRSARRVFWIMDNGSAHQPGTFPQWLKVAHPKAVAVHLPIHASWLNQMEIYFSILQRKALTPMDAWDKEALIHRILGFQKRYSRSAKPFKWNFTHEDLRRVLSSL